MESTPKRHSNSEYFHPGQIVTALAVGFECVELAWEAFEALQTETNEERTEQVVQFPIFRSTNCLLYDKKLWQLLNDLFHNWDMAWYVSRTTHYDHQHRSVAR